MTNFGYEQANTENNILSSLRVTHSVMALKAK